MGNGIYNRSSLLLGDDVMSKMSEVKVIVFGVGGVGSWCVEGLLRSGITNITIVDNDCVSITNINRQLMATTSTVGEVKVEAMRRRLLEINPDANIVALNKSFTAESAAEFHLEQYDYIIDAIDSLKDKAALILKACESGAKFFSSMGAALKLDPTQVRVAEFWNVRGCPLGAALRKKYKRNHTYPAHKFLCVYDEQVLENRGSNDLGETCDYKAQINGSLAHITGIFGMTLCGLVVKDIYEKTV